MRRHRILHRERPPIYDGVSDKLVGLPRDSHMWSGDEPPSTETISQAVAEVRSAWLDPNDLLIQDRRTKIINLGLGKLAVPVGWGNTRPLLGELD
jgi:hypothetical protein